MSIQSNFPNLQPSLLLDFANTKQLDNRVTFTRSTPAVYYDGKTTAMAEQNLLLYSQDFSNFWGLTGNTITPDNTTAPDGTTTADKTERTTTGLNAIVVSSGLPSSLGVPKTVSIYAKAGTKSVIQWDANTANWNNDFYVNFDLSAGTISANSAGVPASITSVGNGWYRCSITSSGVGTQVIWVVCDSPTSLRESTSTAGYLYIWGAQYEQRASATAYTPTTTQAITNYIPVLLTAGGNQPRFDCNPTTGESLGLLIEEQRTNICLYSGDYTNAAWQLFNASKQTLANIAPDGTLTACKIVVNTSASTTHGIYQQVTPASTGVCAMSIYVKAAGYNFACLRIATDADTKRYSIVVNLLTGEVTSTNTNAATNTSYAVQSVGNGWYKLSVTALQSSSFMYIVATPSPTATPTFDSSLPQFTGDGFSGIFVWGGQIEFGSFASSYIATTSASATRTADAASMTGTNFSSWFNTDQGTFYADYNVKQNGFVANINGPSVNVNNIDFVARPSSGTAFEVYSNNSLVVGIGVGVLAGKICASYQTNNFAISINGGTASTDTSGNVANSLTQMSIGSRFDNQYWSNGTFKKIAYYPIAVTSANLQALTS